MESSYNLYDIKPSDLRALSQKLEGLRRLRRNFKKRNYNLDHLARMNFRRSSKSFNNKHILGGL